MAKTFSFEEAFTPPDDAEKPTTFSFEDALRTVEAKVDRGPATEGDPLNKVAPSVGSDAPTFAVSTGNPGGRKSSVLEGVILDQPKPQQFDAGEAERLSRKAYAQFKPKPTSPGTEIKPSKEIEPRGFGGTIADTVLSLGQGAIGLVKGATDNINAGDNPASGVLGKAIEGLDYWKSDYVRDDMIKRQALIDSAHKNGGEIAAARAAFNSTFLNPAAAGDVIGRGVGSLIPTLMMGAAGLGEYSMMAVNALSNAGDAAQQTAEALRKMPEQDWGKDDRYLSLLSQGMTHKQAVETLAPIYALPSQSIGAITGAISGKIGLEQALTGKGLSQSIQARAGRALQEFAGEELETLLPQAVGNITQGSIDGKTSVTSGLGQAFADTALGTIGGSALAAVHSGDGTQVPNRGQKTAEEMARERGFLVPSAKPEDILNTKSVDEAIATAQSALAEPAVPESVINAGKQWQALGITDQQADIEQQRTVGIVGQKWQELAAENQRMAEEAGAQASRNTDARIADVGQKWQDLGITTPAEDLASQKTFGEPVVSWFGRRGDGYQSEEDAGQALPGRQKAQPEFDWKIEPMPNGRFRLAGYALENADANPVVDVPGVVADASGLGVDQPVGGLDAGLGANGIVGQTRLDTASSANPVDSVPARMDAAGVQPDAVAPAIPAIPAIPDGTRGIPEMQAALENAAPMSEESRALSEQLRQAVTADAEASISNGDMPVYQSGQTTLSIGPSAQNPGKFQITRYTKDGVIGDSQYNSIADAVFQEGLAWKPRLSQEQSAQVMQQAADAEAAYQERKAAIEPKQPDPRLTPLSQRNVQAYSGPADVSSRAGQMELANRGGRIASLKAMNDQLRKIAPDEAWADANIENSTNLDALQSSISQALVDAGRMGDRVVQSVAQSPLKARLDELSGQELRAVFDVMSLAGSRMTATERVAALLAEDASEVEAALQKISTSNVSPESQNIDTSAAPVAKAAEIEQVAPQQAAQVETPPAAAPKAFQQLMDAKSTKLMTDDGRGRKLFDVAVTPAFRNKHFVNGRMPTADGLELKRKEDVTGNPSDNGYVLIDNRKQLAERRAAQPSGALEGSRVVGSDAGNGFKHGPQNGERYRVGVVDSVGGAIAIEKRYPAGTAGTFYVGKDGNLIDGDSINLIGNGKEKLWIPATPEQAKQAQQILDEMGQLDLQDPARKDAKERLKQVVSGKSNEASARMDAAGVQPDAVAPVAPAASTVNLFRGEQVQADGVKADIEDQIADLEYQADKFFKGGTEYLGRDFEPEYSALKGRRDVGMPQEAYAKELTALMDEHAKAREAYFAPNAKVNAEHAAMLAGLKFDPVSPQEEAFNRNRDKAVFDLPDDKLKQLGAILGVRQSKNQSRIAFVERITEQPGSDVRSAYLTVSQPTQPITGEGAGVAKPADPRLTPVSQRNVSPEAQKIDTSAAPVAQAAEIEQVAPEAPKAAPVMRVGFTPKDAEAVTVQNGVVYIGKTEAVNFDTGEPVTVAPGATNEQIRDALKASGAISRKSKIFGVGSMEAAQVAPQQAAPVETPQADVVKAVGQINKLVAELESLGNTGSQYSGKDYAELAKSADQQTIDNTIGALRTAIAYQKQVNAKTATTAAPVDSRLVPVSQRQAEVPAAPEQRVTTDWKGQQWDGASSYGDPVDSKVLPGDIGTGSKKNTPWASRGPAVGHIFRNRSSDTQDVVQVGKDAFVVRPKANAELALPEVDQRLVPVSQRQQPASELPDAIQPKAPQRLTVGQDFTPLNEGGKVFKHKVEAQKARKSQPHFSIVKSGKGWALREKTEKQLAAEEQAAKRLSRARVGEKGMPESAHGFIMSKGGLAKSAMSDTGFDKNPMYGNRYLFGNAGVTLARAAEMLHEAGYISDESERSAAEVIRRSATVAPVYTPEGTERAAEIEADTRYADFLAAEQENPAEPIESAVEMGYNQQDAEIAGYDEATRAEQESVNALIAQAEALGIDVETIKEQAYEDTREGTPQDYLAAARAAITAAISESQGNRSANDGGQGDAGSEQRPGFDLELDSPEAQLQREEAARAAAEEEAAKNRAAGAAAGGRKRALNNAEEKARADQIRKERADAAVANFALGDAPPPSKVSTDEAAGQGNMLDAPDDADKPFVESTRATYTGNYETDLFGEPVPQASGANRASKPEGSGLRGNVQRTGELQDTPTPQGEFNVNTIVGSETTRRLGTDLILSPLDAAQATHYLYRSAVERFDGIVTDKQGKPLGVVGGFKGATDQTSVYPGTLIGEAVRIPGAAYIWFSHNHPSGNSTLSRADESLNRTLSDSFKGSGIEPQGLIAVGGSEYSYVDQNGDVHTPGKIPAPTNSVDVPVIERTQQVDRPSDVISDPWAAIGVAKTYFKRSGNGILLLDAQNSISAWIPIGPEMLKPLRGTGALNSLYRSISQANASASILVHGGDLNERLPSHRAGLSIAENIGNALYRANVRVLDAINVNAARPSAAEGGLSLGSGTAPMFSRTQDSTQSGLTLDQFKSGMSEAFGQKVADKLIEKGVVVPLEDQSKLPEHVVPFLRSGDVVFGFHDPKTDRTYAVLSNLTPEMIKPLALHEVGVHYGFEAMLGDKKYAAVMRRLDVMEKAGQKDVVAAAKSAKENSVNERQVPQEKLAYLVQNNPEMGIVREIIAAIKAFLFKEFGIGDKYLTSDDLTALAKAAVMHASRTQDGGSYVPAFAREPSIDRAPVWKSALLDGVNGINAKALTGAMWKDGLKGLVNKGLVKQDEIAWSGLDDWLTMQQGKVQKEAVLQYLQDNGVRVTETELGKPDFSEVGAWWNDEGGANEETPFSELTGQQQSDAAERYADEVGQYAEGERQTPKYSQYQLPGGRDYRELLLTLPEKATEDQAARRERRNAALNTFPQTAESRAILEDTRGETSSPSYRSSHWDQPNVLAHIRFNERTDADGKRVLFIEEIQSDWGQAGKKRGFYSPSEDTWTAKRVGNWVPSDDSLGKWEVFRNGESAGWFKGNAESEVIADAKSRGLSMNSSIPSAPFVTKTDAWVSLALKRMIRYAVDNGFDKVAFVNGEQSAQRYDLSKQVGSITTMVVGGGRYNLRVRSLSDEKILSEDNVDLARIEELVGKDIAKKVEARDGEITGIGQTDARKLTGLDLKVGGEGMKAFYDQIVPSATKALLKKLGGGQMETVKFGAGGPTYDEIQTMLEDFDKYPAGSQQRAALRRQQEAAPDTEHDGIKGTQPGFTITPAMREKASQGLPMFSKKADQTDTPEFRNWFGDSKVVDDEGKPLVVYHGTGVNVGNRGDLISGDFDTFDPLMSGKSSKTGAPSGSFFFTNDPEVASSYTVQWRGDFSEKLKDGANVMPVYLSLRKPLKISAKGENWRTIAYKGEDRDVNEIVRMAQESGKYDGVIIKRVLDHGVGKTSGKPSTTYVAFTPEQIKSATGNTGDFSPTNPDIRFSRSLVTGNPLPTSWQAPDATKMDDLIYSMQDKHIDTKRVVKSVRDSIGALADEIDPYLQEELFHGRAAMQTKEFLEKEVRPLLTDMQARGIEISDFEEYLHNRHAERRNVQVAKINPAMQDGGSGIKTQDARAYLAGLTTAQRTAYEALAKKVDAISKNTRDLLVDSGLEKQATIDAWDQAYGSEYVPLMREEMDNGMGIGQGFSVRGSSSKRAMGSDKPVANIIANIALQREKAITRSEKRKIGEALYGMVLSAPNPDFWIAVDPALQQNPAQITATAMQLISMGMNPADADSIAKEPTQRYVNPVTGLVEERINPAMRSADNVLAVRIDGEDKYVFFNAKDERAMRMAMSLKNLDSDQLGVVMGGVAKMTRYFAAVNTQYNPIFGVTNIARDVQTAMLNLQSTALKGHQADVAKHILPALRGIYIDLRNHRQGKPATSSYAQIFEEFQREGGATGFRDMYANAEERADAIRDEIADIGSGKLKQAGKGIMGWLSDYNETMENAVRVAAYKVAKEQGMSNQQAASLAKNLTVNFNRKGQVALQAGALYAFFNASVQGTARIAQTLTENGKLTSTGRNIIAGGLLIGSMQALLLAAAGFDDDEPPDFVRERSLVIPIGGKKYLSIPMPLGFHIIPNLSRIPTEWAMGGFKNTTKRISQLVGVFADGLNPIGSAGLSIQTITPTIIDPLAAIAENKDWTGKPIAKKDIDTLHPTAGHTRAKDTATPWAKVIAYGVNAATGGTDFKPGMASPTPDQIDYLIGQAFGGVGRELGKLAQVGESRLTGEEIPLHKIPLVGRFVGTTEGQAAESSRFYNNLREIGEHKVEIAGLKKNGRGAEITAYIKDNKESTLYPMADAAQRKVSQLNTLKRDLIKKGASPDRIKLIDMQITSTMKLLNDRARALKNNEPALAQ